MVYGIVLPTLYGYVLIIPCKCSHRSWQIGVERLVSTKSIMFIFHNILHNPSHWRTHIFQRGGSTTNQTKSAMFSGWFSILRISSIHVSEAMLNAKILSDAPDAAPAAAAGSMEPEGQGPVSQNGKKHGTKWVKVKVNHETWCFKDYSWTMVVWDMKHDVMMLLGFDGIIMLKLLIYSLLWEIARLVRWLT